MSQVSPLRLIESGAAPSNRLGSPSVFIRTLTIPPGAPWDQARSAALEAKLGAPLPFDQVLCRVKRLGRWALGRAARFVVCYVRRQDAGARFSATVEVDGRRLEIAFRSPDEERRRPLQVGLTVLVFGSAVALMALAVVQSLNLRSETLAREATTEQVAGARLREAKSQAQLADQVKLLKGVGADQETLEAILGDLSWASAAKASDAHIDELHWENGYMGVVVRGAAAPFTASRRPVLKAQQPIRPGVWLWGVGAVGSAAAVAPDIIVARGARQ